MYSKNDYSLYQRNFHLDTASLLRTDGIYVREKIWTNENGGKESIPAERKIYKFYQGGQANMILDLNNNLKTTQDYINALNARITKTNIKATLFEGYYRLNDKRVVIQSLNTPRRQFNYIYALLESNRLIIVKFTGEGKGQIKDKYYTDYYKEYYYFIPTSHTDYLEPNW